MGQMKIYATIRIDKHGRRIFNSTKFFRFDECYTRDEIWNTLTDSQLLVSDEKVQKVVEKFSNEKWYELLFLGANMSALPNMSGYEINDMLV